MLPFFLKVKNQLGGRTSILACSSWDGTDATIPWEEMTVKKFLGFLAPKKKDLDADFIAQLNPGKLLDEVPNFQGMKVKDPQNEAVGSHRCDYGS